VGERSARSGRDLVSVYVVAKVKLDFLQDKFIFGPRFITCLFVHIDFPFELDDISQGTALAHMSLFDILCKASTVRTIWN
jgi:hypothetical protein